MRVGMSDVLPKEKNWEKYESFSVSGFQVVVWVHKKKSSSSTTYHTRLLRFASSSSHSRQI